MEQPLLSVIVPNYNHARHLPACLDALLAQSVPAAEILVIDDGSTDNSVEVIKSYESKHPTVKLHHNDENMGVVYTMQKGTELARGRYLYLAAADDVAKPGLLEKSLQLLEQHPAAALSCTISHWRDEASGFTWLMGAGMANKPCYLSPDQLVEIERQGRLTIVSHSAIIKADVIREFGGFLPDLKWHCDWFLTYAAAFRHGLCFVPEVLSNVHVHGSSFYGAGSRKAEHNAVMDELIRLLQEERYRDVAARIRASGALALHSTPMLGAMLRVRGGRDFITPRFLWKCAVRRAQLVARRYFPVWLARACARWFTHQRAPAPAADVQP
jgi:glycosyltransferase involved in cell wall biosynthesis